MMSSLRTASGYAVRELQDALFHAAETARTVDTRPYELQPRAQLCQELVPRIHSVMDEALDVLGCLLERYDTPPQAQAADTSGVFDTYFDEAVEPSVPPAEPQQRIADVSFMARWELDRKRSAIAVAQHTDDYWRLLSECCSARRRVVKATSGVEQVLSQVEGCPSVFESLYRSERRRAIETRAAYHSLLSGLKRLEDASERIERDVRLVGTGIACLVGRDVYLELRVKDRLELRRLQRKIFDWLLGPRDPQQGRRLIGDVKAFAELLMEVNHRPVLVEHDREVLQRLQAALRQPATDALAFFELLVSIRGRDTELDDLIDARAELRTELWDHVVERVLQELSEQGRA